MLKKSIDKSVHCLSILFAIDLEKNNGLGKIILRFLFYGTLSNSKRQTETDRDTQRQTETDRDRQRQTETDRDRQRQIETHRDRQRQTETDRDR